ncbi:MAG: radical SAM protein [bacterium]
MKIVLIQPLTNFIEQAYGVKQKVRFGHAPPLGLGYVASLLENDGHEVRILDACAMELTHDETIDVMEDFKPDVAGLTVLTNYKRFAKELAAAIKRRMPHVAVVLGGAHATYFHAEILDDMPGVDHVLYGEVDTVVRDYVRHLRDPDKLHSLKGLVYRNSKGKAVVNPRADILESLDDVPMPAWHLYDFSLYRPLPLQYRRLPFFTMITSRGCWWQRCKFCFQSGGCAMKYRRNSPGRVADEVEILYHRYGIREIAFWDDTFIMNLGWLKNFTGLLKEKNLDVTWTASGRANTMNEEIIRTIHDAGCWSMFIGVESGCQELLDVIDKGITLEQARKVFAAASKVGIETRGAFMLGLPGETPRMGRKTIDFAVALDPTYAIFYATHPRFGTQLYDIAQRTGKLIDKDFRGMSKVTYVPDAYRDARELENLIRSAYLRFYLRPRYILKTLLRMRSLTTAVEIVKGFLLFLGLSATRSRRRSAEEA